MRVDIVAAIGPFLGLLFMAWWFARCLQRLQESAETEGIRDFLFMLGGTIAVFCGSLWSVWYFIRQLIAL